MTKILIVDDETELRELLSIYLKMKGFDVVEAISGKAALIILNQNKDISLIISDIQMPNGDGMFLLHALKNELKSTIPIFMYTGGSSKELSFYKQMGASAVFEKPMNLKNLVLIIHDFLELKTA